MQILVIDEPALNIGKLVEHLKKFGDHSDLSELVPSPNIPMQANAQIATNLERAAGYLEIAGKFESADHVRAASWQLLHG